MYDSPNLLRLDFDQYQRYRSAAELLNSIPGIWKANPGAPFRLLEAGSNVINLFPDFFADSNIEVQRCDIIALDHPDAGYVQIEAGKPLPFPDNSFHVVAALEVLEHMPVTEREYFIRECVRVASQCVILSAPRGGEDVVLAEDTLKRYIRERYGCSLAFLDEHVQFGLPRVNEIVAILESLKLPWHGQPNSLLDRWLATSWLSHYVLGMHANANEGAAWLRVFNCYYNSTWYEASAKRACYRMLWAVVKDPDLFHRLPNSFGKPVAEAETTGTQLLDEALKTAIATSAGYTRAIQNLVHPQDAANAPQNTSTFDAFSALLKTELFTPAEQPFSELEQLVRKHFDSKEEEFARLGSQIKKSEDQQRAANALIQNLRENMQNMNSTLSVREKELQHARGQADAVMESLNGIRNSATWRKTQWLRDMKKKAREALRGSMRYFPSAPLKASVRYYLRVDAPIWDALTVRLGTHGHPAHGTLQLKILEAERVVRTAAFDLSQAVNNGPARFTFDALPGNSQTFILEFELVDSSGQSVVSIYEADNRRLPLKVAQKALGRRQRWAWVEVGQPQTAAAAIIVNAPAVPAPPTSEQAVPFHAPSVANTASLPLPAIIPAAGRADLVLLLPAIRSISFSGGPNTAFILCALLAQRGVRINAVSLNIPLESEEIARKHIASLVGDDSVLDNIRFSCGQKNNPPMQLGSDDMMMATAWWTAVRAMQLLPSTRRKNFFYLLQDFEPLFYGWSPEHALAMETYGYPIVPIVNEQFLADYFFASGVGRFSDPLFRKETLVFQPAIDRSRFHPAQERPGKKQILFYARPSAPRNLYDMGMEALQWLLRDGTIDAEQWEIRLMGDTIPPTDLGHGMVVRSLPWMDFEGYAQNMRRATVGLSLMLSPHTSYPPLEMAASGVKVVTTVYGNKNAKGLQALSRNLIPAEPSVASVAAGLQRAIEESSNPIDALSAADIALPRTWDEAFAPVLDRVIGHLEKGTQEAPRRTIFLPTHTVGRAFANPLDYPAWRHARFSARSQLYRTESREAVFSIQTTVFDTPAFLLFELQRSISAQEFPHFEWNILDNGSTDPEVIEAIQALGRMDARFRVWRVDANLHIIGGNRLLLERARNPYVIPVDGDDLLAPDALKILAFFIEKQNRPELLYSDEEKIGFQGAPHEPILRHGASILTSYSHCFYSHLACFDRKTALDAQVYSGEYARGSHDWDTWFRLCDRKIRAVHVPEVLYGWRMTPASTAAATGNKEYIISSQKAVLEASLARRGLAPFFEVLPDPFMEPGYWALRRRPVAPQSVRLVFIAGQDVSAASAAFEILGQSLQGYPPERIRVTIVSSHSQAPKLAGALAARSDWVRAEPGAEFESVNAIISASLDHLGIVVDDRSVPDSADWLWQAAGLFELDGNLAVLSGPVMSKSPVESGQKSGGAPQGTTVCTVRVGGLNGDVGMPLLGETVPTIFHRGRETLLQSNCSFVAMPWVAVRPALFAKLGGFRMDFRGSAPGSVDLCSRAAKAGFSTGYAGEIFFRSRIENPDYSFDRSHPLAAEVLAEAAGLIRDDPYYHPFRSLDPKTFRALSSAEDRAQWLSRSVEAPPEAVRPGRADGLPTARYDLSTRGVAELEVAAPVAANSDDSVLPKNNSPYMARRLEFRRDHYKPLPRQGTLSLVTSAYNTPVRYLNILAQSVLTQDYPHFEWVLVDNGSTDPETIWALKRLQGVKNIKFCRIEKNAGILGGMRRGLLEATGEYILPLDSDDFLYRDALRIMAWHIEKHGQPALLYSDEDLIEEEKFLQSYQKPDWDLVLFLNSCYIAHLCALKRTLALEYSLYTDHDIQGCHDWHSFLTFALKGHTPVHVPEVLYSWRIHAGSCAGDIRSKTFVYSSHQKVLNMFLASVPHRERYRLELSPLFDGMPDWTFRRTTEPSRPIRTVVLAQNPAKVNTKAHQKASGYPGHRANAVSLANGLPQLLDIAVEEVARGGLIHIVHEEVHTEGSEWPWEILTLTELHPDTVLIAGRVLSPTDKVLASGAYFGVNGGCGSPDVGRAAADSGYFAQMWKQRSVSAPMTALMVADAGFLADFLRKAPADMTLPFLGAWAGAYAQTLGKRTIYTPFLMGRASSESLPGLEIGARESAAFTARNKPLIPETRYLGRGISLDPAKLYAPDPGRAGEPAEHP